MLRAVHTGAEILLFEIAKTGQDVYQPPCIRQVGVDGFVLSLPQPTHTPRSPCHLRRLNNLDRHTTPTHCRTRRHQDELTQSKEHDGHSVQEAADRVLHGRTVAGNVEVTHFANSANRHFFAFVRWCFRWLYNWRVRAAFDSLTPLAPLDMRSTKSWSASSLRKTNC